MRSHLVGLGVAASQEELFDQALSWASTMPEALLVCQAIPKRDPEDRSSHVKFLAMMGKRKNPNAVALGRRGGLKGGQKGGKARWEGVSKEQRQAIAQKAAFARWGRAKKTKTGKTGW